MRRSIVFLFIACFLTGPVISQQPSQKEIQAQMQQMVKELKDQIAELEKQISDAKKNEEEKSTIKDMEEQLSMLKQQLGMIQKITGTVSKIPTKDIQEVIDNNDPNAPKKFPKVNPALLESLPKLSSKANVTSYVNDLHNQFLKKVNPELVTSFKQIETQLEKDILKMEVSALAAWYNEAPSQSILLMTKAAANPKASDLTLNNLAALLNLGSLENKSLPILRYLENIHPDNAMVLNNLGQAYTGLGELNSAMMYFGRCIEQEPNHPQANYTAGEIELSRGNTIAATQYFKNSLYGAFKEEVLQKVKPESSTSFKQIETPVEKDILKMETPPIATWYNDGPSQDILLLTNALEPNYQQANYTDGEIELSSSQHFKNSLNKDYTGDIRLVEPDMDIDEYITHNLHIPEYFNENKYNVPAQCQNVNEAEALSAIYNGYNDMVNPLYEKYHTLSLEYAEKAKQDMQKRAEDAFAMKKLSMPPFFKKAGYAWDALMKKQKSDGEWLAQMDQDYRTRTNEIYEGFQSRSRSAGSDCATQTANVNQYLREMADVTKAWQLKHITFNKKYINQVIYWSFLNSFSSNEFKWKFYTWVASYLNEMRSIAKTELWGPPCKEMEQRNTPAREIPIEEPECPIDLEIKLIVGKIALNCQKFSFSGGELVRFKYEKNFKSKQSTMELGIGFGIDLGTGFGGYKGSVSLNASESIFITWDGNNSISDLGLSMGAKAAVGVEKSSSMKVGDIVQEISNTKNIGSAETGVNATVGIDSGWTFNEGPLNSVLNSAPTQINPNVNIYKGNK